MAVLIVLAGCGGDDSGDGPGGTGGSATDTAKPAHVFTGIQACDVLGPAIKGARFGEPRVTVLGPHYCQAGDLEIGVIGLRLMDDAPFDALVMPDAAEEVETSVAGRDAIQVRFNDSGDGCKLSIYAGPRSRAIVSLGVPEQSVADTCAELNRFAEKVVSELPAL